MLRNIIRYSFILITSCYAYFKLLNTEPTTHSKFKFLSISIFASICSYLIFNQNEPLQILFILVVLFFVLKGTSDVSLSLTYTTCLVSFSLSYIIFNLSSIILLFALIPFYYNNYSIPWNIVACMVSLLQFLLIHCCFHIPRLRKGMSFLYHIPSGNIGFSLCFLLITLILIFCEAKTAIESYMLIFSALILIFTFLLIYWWNYQLTQTYKKYLKKNEIDSLNQLLADKDIEITYLRNENDKLSRIIHKDNKMIPALSMAVTDFLENKNKLPLSELEQLGSSLQTQLKLLYDTRLELITDYQQEILPIPSTGFSSVDAVLLYMQKKALQAGMEYKVTLSEHLSNFIPDKISEPDCSHLLSDLLENAIIASKGASRSLIQIYMGTIDDIFTIKVSNTGQPFHIETLGNLGLTRHTTHKETGGSGIGMMDIWEIKERNSATFLIDELTNFSADSCTSISLLFNRKNHYIIQSDRYKELIATINRPDLLIFSKES